MGFGFNHDLHNTTTLLRGVAPNVITDNTPAVSQIIDTRGYGALEFLISLGTLSDSDATAVVLVEHSDAADLSGGVAVPDDVLLGTELQAAFRFDDDNGVRKIGYKVLAGKRYVRMTITPSGNTGNIPLCVMALLGGPFNAPTPSQADT